MTPLEEAKAAILEWMCASGQRWGEKASTDRAILQRELKIDAAVFSQAIRELVADGFLAYVSDKPTSIRLDHAGIAHCEQKK